MKLAHIGWNLSGLSLPLVVAALVVPSLIERLGAERFGLLALAWGLIGYAGALDLGIGRALTQQVAKLKGQGSDGQIGSALATAVRITFISGSVGGMLIAILGWFEPTQWLNTNDTSVTELQWATVLMGVALPAQAMSASYRGVNEAYRNFKGISILRMVLGMITFGGPYIVSLYTLNLTALVATLVVSRLVALFIFRYLADGCLNRYGVSKGQYCSARARQLFAFGGWVTVSSIVSPFLVQGDRFVIGAVLSAAAVTVYVLPYEIVVQSLIIVGAISSVAFPVLSEMVVNQNGAYRAYFKTWLKRVMILMALVCGALALLLPYILRAWIPDSLDPTSIVVGQVLCLGVWMNAVASMFFALIQAKGRADLTAKAHLLELPLFIGALLWLLPDHGVVAAAWVWVGRATLDLILLASMTWATSRYRGRD
jgi:O-antigen/teichoic acid export membrane protein